MEITPTTTPAAAAPVQATEPTTEQIIAAWRNPATTKDLPAGVRNRLPTNPAGGNVDFTELLSTSEALAPERHRTHGGPCHTQQCFSHTCASLLCKTSRYHCR